MNPTEDMPSLGWSPSRLEWIDHLCDAFEAAWQEGHRPPMEAYLAAAAEPKRAKLME
jgi:hypothetical protein